MTKSLVSLPNKDIKVQNNKLKFSDVCHPNKSTMAIKCPLLQLPASLAANPMLAVAILSFYRSDGKSLTFVSK